MTVGGDGLVVRMLGHAQIRRLGYVIGVVEVEQLDLPLRRHAELIPVADSDYVFAAVGEELGLFGGLLLTFALIVFVSAGVRTALDSRDMFSKLCSIGLVAFIGFQALVNIGGITRALPMTGITLPFVSHGGFSLITSFFMLGMLMAFSHRNAVDRQINSLNALP